MNSKERAQRALNELVAVSKDIAYKKDGSPDAIRRHKLEEMMWDTYQKILDSNLLTDIETDQYTETFESQKAQKEVLFEIRKNLKELEKLGILKIKSSSDDIFEALGSKDDCDDENTKKILH